MPSDPSTGEVALPPGWTRKSLAELCRILSGGTPPKSEARYWNGEVPWVSGKDMKSARLFDAIDHVSADAIGAGTRMAPVGAVFVLVRGMGLARDLPVAVAKRPMAFNQDIKALVPKVDGMGPFIRAAIYANKAQLLARIVPSAHGTMTLNLDDIESFEVAAPDDDAEAIAIGELLDHAHDLADSAAQELVVSEHLKRAAMRALFTKGLRGEAQKDTEIGLMPESWAPRTLLDLCVIQSGGTPRKSVAEYWIGEIPWVSGKDLKVPTLRDTVDHISQAGVEAGSRITPADAVLILVRGMGLAKDLPVSVISRPMAFNQDLKALVSRGEFSGSFIRSAIYFEKEHLLSRIVASAHGTMTLNLDDIETLKVPCPSDPEEAKEIVAILDAIDRKIDLHKRKRAVLDELFKALLHKLMTGEIRVADLDLSALSTSNIAESAA